MSSIRYKLHEENRLSWNAATKAHNSHKTGQVEFLKSGGSTLFPEESGLLGDVKEKRIAHLLCNSGQDTLSIAACGARIVGVDISDQAVSAAKTLSRETGIAAEFRRADVYSWLEASIENKNKYDIAFMSYGALCWLSDIERFASYVAKILAPSGRIVVVEFHPFAYVFDEKMAPRWKYFSFEGIETDSGVQDYVAASRSGLVPWGYEEGVTEFDNPNVCHSFPWGMGEIVQAIVDAGLVVDHLKEYPYANGCRLFDEQRMDTQRRWQWRPGVPKLPVMFSLSATKLG